MRSITIENFFQSPGKEREAALASTFSRVEHNGIDYNGISEVSDPEGIARLEKIIGIEVESAKIVYRRYLKDEPQSTFIHCDANLSDWTCVAFLTSPVACRGGLAFWRHRKTGWEFHPTPEEMKSAGAQNSKEFWDSLLAEGLDASLWQMIEYVPVGFNRAVIFPSAAFHSRWPKESTAVSVENARLIKTYFLKCKRTSK
jgi:hypothetical protein